MLNDGVIPPGGSEATTPCVPDFRGGTVFNPPSYDPALQLFYVMARETCAYYTPQKQELQAGPRLHERRHAQAGRARLQRAARDRSEDRRRSSGSTSSRPSSLAGVMSTASGVVFAGDHEGYFNAFERKTGKRLWSYRTGSPIWGAAASTYMLDGRQYVLIPSGNTIVAFARAGEVSVTMVAALARSAVASVCAVLASRPRRRRGAATAAAPVTPRGAAQLAAAAGAAADVRHGGAADPRVGGGHGARRIRGASRSCPTATCSSPSAPGRLRIIRNGVLDPTPIAGVPGVARRARSAGCSRWRCTRGLPRTASSI